MRQIIALGGGGFSMEPDNFLLDHYILEQSGQTKPKVCFVPTASGDSEDYIGRFYRSFHEYNCEPSHLSLFRPPSTDLEDFILAKDVIYVGGGNTKNLLALWREWGLDTVMRKAWESGRILSGVSAGAICWFEEGVTDSFGPELRGLACLGFLAGSCCPHYDGESNRRPTYQGLIHAGQIQSGFAADDGVALHFIDNELSAVISSRPSARAYSLNLVDEQVVESMMNTTYLGNMS